MTSETNNAWSPVIMSWAQRAEELNRANERLRIQLHDLAESNRRLQAENERLSRLLIGCTDAVKPSVIPTRRRVSPLYTEIE